MTRPGSTTDQHDQRHRGLAVALICLVTVVAFETMSVATIMPAVLDDIGGLSLYGWVFSALALGQMLGIVGSGIWVDGANPAVPVAAGLGVFVVGLGVSGSASSMLGVVVGRFLQGFGSGVVPTVAYVCVGRGFAATERPRIFALMSSAWLVPSLVGPLASAWLVSHVSWRWVFLGLVPVTMVVAAFALAPIRRLGEPAVSSLPSDQRRRANAERLALAVAATVGAGVMLAGFQLRTTAAIVAVSGTGLTVTVAAFRRIVPAGTLRARGGVPAVIAVRGLLTASFFGAEVYVTLALTDLRATSVGFAGFVLGASSFTWTAGSWIQSRQMPRWGARRLVQGGITLVGVGIALQWFVVATTVPVLWAVAAWGLCAFGIGLAYAPLSASVLAAAPEGAEGKLASSLQLSDVLGMAVGTGFGGVAIALVDRGGGTLSTSISFIWWGAVVIAGVGVFAARGVPGLSVHVRSDSV